MGLIPYMFGQTFCTKSCVPKRVVAEALIVIIPATLSLNECHSDRVGKN